MNILFFSIIIGETLIDNFSMTNVPPTFNDFWSVWEQLCQLKTKFKWLINEIENKVFSWKLFLKSPNVPGS